MSIYHYPTISIDGLIMYLDSANTQSYSGTGASWYDITNSGNDATLFNTPTYSSSTNKGILTFASASSEYATCPIQPTYSTFTVEVWVKLNTLPTTNVTTVITQEYPGTNSKINYSIGYNGANSTGAFDGKLNVGFFDGAWRCTSGFSPVVGTWYHVAMTYNGSTIIQYLNGTSQSTLNYVGTPTTSGGLIRLMRRWDSTDFTDGILPVVRIYNRVLSSTEMLNNYMSIKARYGL